ncbi:hypothetical protein, unlikely [Trypanosoma congolense IL3000]|uniref:Uncharacterized protein TCIL3000_8_7480 n=1 Tax=Trypanosoma congolense (strain IL3000) TaxID=1068625 RepID=F9W9Z8_TRYCI|nr:unnamed protein product [Trypanosoma congolense IL3000]CCC92526.1 unnamed protein product [Trypanosoma congolense IL3000]CCD14053.1 hypothetical protein, unlikely [Trypanosoma congolense IL3000]
MVSALSLEVNVIVIPAFIVFVLFIIPIPLLSRVMSRVLGYLERVNFYGVSLLTIAMVATFLGFVSQFFEWRKRYGGAKPNFVDVAMEIDWEGKKWRHERNMYIHALATVLCSAVVKFARLHNALEKKSN